MRVEAQIKLLTIPNGGPDLEIYKVEREPCHVIGDWKYNGREGEGGVLGVRDFPALGDGGGDHRLDQIAYAARILIKYVLMEQQQNLFDPQGTVRSEDREP